MIQDILDFWYSEPMRQHWFKSNPEIDQQIRQRYEMVWKQAVCRELDSWQQQAKGCLALVIIFDQFPLNMFRKQAQSFSTEQRAVSVTKYALEQCFDKELPKEQVSFLYMPLMHSESMADQDLCVRLFEEADLEENLRFARHHREIVRQFGRFPHRNAILGRSSTPEEVAYLKSSRAFLG